VKSTMRRLIAVIPAPVLICFAALAPQRAEAVPSFARQTGLPCSGCHYDPPELNPAGRLFKLLAYVQRSNLTEGIVTEGGKKTAGLDLLKSLPLSVMLETSYTSLNSPEPNQQNGNFELPQDISLYLSGAWTSNVGSFLQVTYDTQDDHFGIDNTDIRYANQTKLDGKSLVYGLDFNNNPTVEDLWNSTPAWGFPWVESDFAPTPAAVPIIDGPLAQDVAGFGGYSMWDNHLYLDVTAYTSEHAGGQQPNSGVNFPYNIRGAAPYWRLAYQKLTNSTQYEIGTYGMHVRSSPNSATGPENDYTDYAFDTQIDRTLFRTDVLSFRGTYIRENSNLLASLSQGLAARGGHDLNTFTANAEYHIGNKYTGTFAWFDTSGTPDQTLYAPAPVFGSANGSPRSAGYIVNLSYWPWQNLQITPQYTGYTRFNGGSTNYDGFKRSASANNTLYLDVRFLF